MTNRYIGTHDEEGNNRMKHSDIHREVCSDKKFMCILVKENLRRVRASSLWAPLEKQQVDFLVLRRSTSGARPYAHP